MSAFKISGTITDIKDTIRVTDKFSKREVWVEIKGHYPQTIALEFSNTNTKKLDDHSIGDNVEIIFSIRGRIWQDRCFNTLAATEISLEGERKAIKAKSVAAKKQYTAPEFKESEDFARETILPSTDDLPF